MSYQRLGLREVLAVAWIGVQIVAPLSALAADLTTIRHRGHLVVAVKDNMQPLGFRNDQGQLEGLEIDIAHRLAEELLGDEMQVMLYPVSNQERLPVLLSGEVDLVIARVTATPSRARLVDFSDPYYIDGTTIVTKDPSIQRIADLNRRAIAILDGSTTINTLRFLLPQADLIGVHSYQDALNQLESGEAVAFAADASVLTGWIQTYPDYHLLPGLLSAEALSIAMPKGLQYYDLRQQVNEAITRWRAEGWLQERIEHWGLPE
jgi:polar amino acid transport system substrate-binding protein